MCDIGITEKKAGLYEDSEFRAAIDETCTEIVSASSYHRPDVADKIKSDESMTLRTEKMRITPGIARGLFGPSVRGYELFAGFKLRKVKKYGASAEDITIQPSLHMQAPSGEWSEVTVDLPSEEAADAFATAKWLAKRLKARKDDL